MLQLAEVFALPSPLPPPRGAVRIPAHRIEFELPRSDTAVAWSLATALRTLCVGFNGRLTVDEAFYRANRTSVHRLTG